MDLRTAAFRFITELPSKQGVDYRVRSLYAFGVDLPTISLEVVATVTRQSFPIRQEQNADISIC